MKPITHFLPPLDWAAIDSLTAGRSICLDSRKIKPGDVFLAFRGESTDGRHHIAHALEKGAAAVLWETDHFELNSAWQRIPNLGIAHLREQAGIIAAHTLGYPSKALKVTGVTGTNGKTSITHGLAQAFTLLGEPCGLMGTIGNGFLPALEKTSHTTPDPLAIQTGFSRFQKEGAHRVVMEVSSHSLAQARVYGTVFDTAVFTNLTRDHLDYHKTMATYRQEKAKLFEWDGLRAAVINRDDEWGRQLLSEVRCPLILSYGFSSADVHAIHLETSTAGIEMEVQTPLGRGHLRSSLLGRFNASNLLACLSVLLANQVPLASALAVLSQINAASGRMQTLGGGGALPLVIVDYAHTPDALEKVLHTIREWMPRDSQLFCVFGCGGNRDPGKRALMGQVAAQWADQIMITSDNPRDENPESIIQDITAGFPKTADFRYDIEPDRQQAIQKAIQRATGSDIVLIAGKGHEAYQEVKGVFLPFNDVTQANQVLAIKRKIPC